MEIKGVSSSGIVTIKVEESLNIFEHVGEEEDDNINERLQTAMDFFIFSQQK